MKSENSVNQLEKSTILLWILCAVLAMAYFMPWLSSLGTALTLGAFDLSEWASLHPSVVNSSPALLVPLVLRLIPLLIVATITINTTPSLRNTIWWVAAGIMVMVAIAMFPPLEFITSERGNINYRQMFFVSVGTLLTGSIGLSGVFYRYRHALTALIGVIGLICTGISIGRSYELYANFFLPRSIGIGAILTILTFIVIALFTIWQVIGNKKG